MKEDFFPFQVSLSFTIFVSNISNQILFLILPTKKKKNLLLDLKNILCSWKPSIDPSQLSFLRGGDSLSSQPKKPFFCIFTRDMVERSYSLNMSRTRMTDLRIALYEQTEIIHQLQEELEAEREASASSASEALAMILRLQIEKEKLAMEANHAEISLDFLKGLIHQKELEITALEYQVQAYRFKLLSSGWGDFPGHDDLRLKVNNLSLYAHTGDSGRRVSDTRCDMSRIPVPEPVLDLSDPVEKGVIEQSVDSGKYSDKFLSGSPRGDLDPYWEHIKKLDERVEEITGFRDSLIEKYKKLKQDSVTVSEKGEKGEDFESWSNDQDIFEEKAKVPVKMVSKQKRLEKKPSKQIRDRVRVSCSVNGAEYRAELQRLRERIERLEAERTSEVTETSGEKSLWKQIKEEFISVISEIKISITNNKLRPGENPSPRTLQEAMLHFWF
ncbi:PREDICTED: uncharacterized protein LOC104803906 [Tarenaya hassleriana]|uniref:uncharacterized protein LOC104803906 n=1 Tax=Tarenaya hassleriana TaxID=28532 RepID=UPI00053C7CC9|nr:PREDICTED: uncharacterized protein LOC104803906 [Tarenaya hassleriana]